MLTGLRLKGQHKDMYLANIQRFLYIRRSYGLCREHIGHTFHIEESVLVSLLQANFAMESQIHEEEVNRLSLKNIELTAEPSNKDFEIDNLRTQLIE